MELMLREGDEAHIKSYFNFHPDTDIKTEDVKLAVGQSHHKALALAFLGELYLQSLND